MYKNVVPTDVPLHSLMFPTNKNVSQLCINFLLLTQNEIDEFMNQ
jgi:hypothetical protein